MESTAFLSIILSNLWTNEFRKSADCVARHLRKLLHWIDSLSEDELFLPQQRAWATTKAQWPLWKWIHINSVALFSFRTQIRKWKSVSLKSYPHFSKSLTSIFKFSTENFVDEISCFSKNFSTMLICSTLNLCKFEKEDENVVLITFSSSFNFRDSFIFSKQAF